MIALSPTDQTVFFDGTRRVNVVGDEIYLAACNGTVRCDVECRGLAGLDTACRVMNDRIDGWSVPLFNPTEVRAVLEEGLAL